MHLPKLSIVIATRERADTLFYTLKTVTEQNYSNLEIIVSDNASKDNTFEVVKNFKDTRIIYSSTEKRVGMSNNWEHGLSLVTGDYVMFLGDDDGLLPSACSDVADIINSTKTKALIWNKADYTWPSVSHYPNKLSTDITNDIVEIDSKFLLSLVAKGLTGYGRLPVIYSGFVSMEIILRIKAITGVFFNSVTPDVYSGIVIAQALEKYLYSTRPFSVNGGSHHSNGISSSSAPQSSNAKLFFSESNIQMNAGISVIPGSISSCVAEAFLQAYNLGLTGGVKLAKGRYLRKIYSEIVSQPISLRNHGLSEMGRLKLPGHLRKMLNQISQVDDFERPSAGFLEKNNTTMSNNIKKPILLIDGNDFGLLTVYDACKLIGNLIGPFSLPNHSHKMTFVTVLVTQFCRILRKAINPLLLPF